MRIKRSPTVGTMILLAGLGFGLARPAVAQSEAELRQENQQLKQQVEDLTRQLTASQRRVEDLERRVQMLSDALQRAAQNDGSQPPMTEPEVTIDESKPGASPRALLAALRADYDEATAELELGEDGDRQRIGYQRTVERWINAANRKYKTKIEWHVKITDPPLARNPSRLKLVAVDPVTRAELGEPFEIAIDKQFARRLQQIETRNGLDRFIVKGVLTPRLVFDSDVLESGPFNRPFVVGPFAIFRYTIEPSVFLPQKEPAEDDAG